MLMSNAAISVEKHTETEGDLHQMNSENGRIIQEQNKINHK